MTVKPADLGDRWHIAVVRYRALGTARVNFPPRIGALGRLWSRGMSYPEPVIAATLPLITDTTNFWIGGASTACVLFGLAVCFLSGFSLPVVVTTALIVGILLLLFLVVLPRRLFWSLHERPVNWHEVEALKGGRIRKSAEEKPARRVERAPFLKLFEGVRGSAPRRPGDALEVEFLRLVQEAVDTKGLPPAANSEVRRMLRTVGEAVGKLPSSDSVAADGSLEDTPVALLAQTDPSVARALANNEKLRQRMQTLREDMLEDIRAIRSLLPSIASDGVSAAEDFGRFAMLTASVRSIAAEAASVAEARDEIALGLPVAPPLPLPTQHVQHS